MFCLQNGLEFLTDIFSQTGRLAGQRVPTIRYIQFNIYVNSSVLKMKNLEQSYDNLDKIFPVSF